MAQTLKTKWVDMSGLSLIVGGIRVGTKPNGSTTALLSSTGAYTGPSVTATGALKSYSATATPAAASMIAIVQGGSAGVGIYMGTGAPSAAAAKGSLYIRTDASSTTTRLYINTDGSTTWATFTTSA